MNPDTAPSAFPYLLQAVVGGAMGAFFAVVASWFGKRAMKFFPDILLGAGGYLGGVAVTPRIPWHINTITYHIGGAVVRTSSRHYQYPYRVGFLLSAVLPLLFELIRFVVERRKTA